MIARPFREWVHFLADRQGKTPRQVLEENDAQALASWRAYFYHNPPADLWGMFATICALLAQIANPETSRRAEDFLPRTRRQRELAARLPKNPEEWKHRFAAMIAPASPQPPPESPNGNH